METNPVASKQDDWDHNFMKREVIQKVLKKKDHFDLVKHIRPLIHNHVPTK